MKTKIWLLVFLVMGAMETGHVFSTDASAATKLSDFARSTDGRVLNMNLSEATKYCHAQGQRLPTVRELAFHAQSLGAQGVSEVAKHGYYLIQGAENWDAVGNPDYFYFSKKGYHRSTESVGGYWSWSSSFRRYSSHSTYVLYEETGSIGDIQNGVYNAAVRCVQTLW